MPFPLPSHFSRLDAMEFCMDGTSSVPVDCVVKLSDISTDPCDTYEKKISLERKTANLVSEGGIQALLVLFDPALSSSTMNILEPKPPDPFLRSSPLSCAGLFSSQYPKVFPSAERSTPSALLSCSGLPINVPTSKIYLGRSEISAFEHSIQTILDPLAAVLRSAYQKSMSSLPRSFYLGFSPSLLFGAPIAVVVTSKAQIDLTRRTMAIPDIRKMMFSTLCPIVVFVCVSCTSIAQKVTIDKFVAQAKIQPALMVFLWLQPNCCFLSGNKISVPLVFKALVLTHVLPLL
ncbi:hypothetical protein Cgig2_022163 [Carnegiea gigantea]|uniref:Uncharacterized protein n=1 Tax=Carnegiea gigantea TaxID=171969 RepID=A0A9Q1GQ78_9CARY|nr:hypothetical protein Cgig2_022163 [Carnegiea gigantea]